MIILVRHGQTTTNAKGLLIGRSDPELSELGVRQARAVATMLEGVQEVWTSPLQRARATAQLCVPALSASVKEAFIEVDYGDFEGRAISDDAVGAWRRHENAHDEPFPNGESLAQLDARVHRELDVILEERSALVADLEHHLAIVTHASPVKSALAWALGCDGEVAWHSRLSNGSVTTVSAMNGRPVLVRFNAVPLLD